MSGPSTDERDPIDEPFVDDDERAEVEWLQARATDPSAPPPSPEIARDYAELEGLLAALPDPAPDELAQARVMAAIRAAQHQTAPAASGSRWRWAAAAVALAAAAGIAIYLSRPPKHTAEPELAVIARPGPVSRGGPGEVHVGDTLVVSARPHGPTELRIYRGARTVIAHCPGDAGCATASGPWHLELQVNAPVDHHVVLVYGAVDAPLDATLDEYLAAAHAAGARVVEHPPIEVR